MKFDKVLHTLTLTLFLSSCCNLPFVYCGPKIMKLHVKPSEANIDIDIRYNAWQYFSRESKDPTILHVDCEFLKSDSILIDRAIIYVPQNAQQGKIEADLFNRSAGEDSSDPSFSFQFPNCCENYPLAVNLDSIPIIRNGDTSCKSIRVMITK